jgi:tryptophan synthase beta subunit
MIVKESIHKLIIQTYYLVLKGLNKFPSPAEVKQQAGEALQDGAEKVGEAVQSGREMAGVAGERIGVMGTNATEVVKNAGGGVSGKVGDAIHSGKEYAGVAAERSGVAGSNATETAKNANDHASKEAGHLLGNAQEMLGDKIKNVGEGIKPDGK